MIEAAKKIYVYPEFTHKVTKAHDSDIEYIRADIVEEMRKKLEIALQVFRNYQAYHEYRDAFDKADRNKGYADQMEAALKLLEDQ